jgi:hypothetical protein
VKSVYDKSFRYTPAVKTNVAETFERVRREQQDAAKEKAEKIVGKITPKKGKANV